MKRYCELCKCLPGFVARAVPVLDGVHGPDCGRNRPGALPGKPLRVLATRFTNHPG